MNKSFLSAFLITVVSWHFFSSCKGPGVVGAAAATFPDIKSPILLEAVMYLNEKGVIKGYPDGTFKPDQVINRAEALKIIFESRGITVEEETNSGFPDVDSSQWFAKYVTSAKKLGLISGYAGGTYKPTQFVNKAEFLKISMLAQSYFENPTDLSIAVRQFTDLDSKEWYVPYVAFALENNFLDKVSKLSPTAGMTRGEAALIIYRVTQYNRALAIEPAPYLSCETCVNGIDLSQYEWSKSEFVNIKDGKIKIGIYDYTEDNLATWTEAVTHLEDKKTIAEVPLATKMNVDKEYPKLYERAIGIHGGYQWPTEYSSSPDGDSVVPLNKDGIRFRNCECNFEAQLLSRYSNLPVDQKGPFENWIKTDAAKPLIYDTIYWYNKNPDYSP